MMLATVLWKNPLLVLILTTTLVQAQSKMDSLRKELPASKGFGKIKIHNQLSEILWRNNDLKSALSEAEQALALAEKLRDNHGTIAALENLGMASKNEYATKILFLQKALILAEQTNDLETVVRTCINIAQTFTQPNNNERALEYYLKALSVNKHFGDRKLEARALSGIGWIYKSSKKYQLALESYQRSLALAQETNDSKSLGWTYIACASVYLELNDYSHALAYCQPAYEHFELQNDSSGMAISLYRIGEVYVKQLLWDDATPYLNRSLAISESHQYGAFIAIGTKLLGEVYSGKNLNDKAFEYYLRSFSVAQRLNMREHVSEVSKRLAGIYKAKGDFKNALQYYEMYVSSYDSVFNQEKSKQIGELQARFETENKEREIEALKKDRQINKIYRITGAVFLFLLLVISLLVTNRQRLKAKKNSEISRKENQLLEKEVEKQKLSEEKLLFTIEHNNKSLTAYTLNLIHKNEMLEDIKTQVQQIRILPEHELRVSLNSLVKTVNYSVHLDKHWDNFKHHFEQVHQGFFDKLKEQYPDLSPNDLRLCSLIKLNLETKQIATLLDISTESAKVARSRIRKKMGLQMEQNLQEFLQTF